MRLTRLLWVAVLAVMMTAGCARTDRPEAKDAVGRAVGTGGAGADVKDDGEFVHEIALMNMEERELSRIALDRATSPNIKVFAQMMVDDLDAAGDKLKSAIGSSPIGWPAQLDEKRRKSADDLAKKQGAEFDRDYVKAMVEGHQDFGALLESRLDLKTVADWKAAAAGRTQSKAMPEPKIEMRDVQVRPEKSDDAITTKINQWAAETYPVVQKHLDTARTLENAAEKRSSN
jgi:putative membrane protein